MERVRDVRDTWMRFAAAAPSTSESSASRLVMEAVRVAADNLSAPTYSHPNPQPHQHPHQHPLWEAVCNTMVHVMQFSKSAAHVLIVNGKIRGVCAATLRTRNDWDLPTLFAPYVPAAATVSDQERELAYRRWQMEVGKYDPVYDAQRKDLHYMEDPRWWWCNAGIVCNMISAQDEMATHALLLPWLRGLEVALRSISPLDVPYCEFFVNVRDHPLLPRRDVITGSFGSPYALPHRSMDPAIRYPDVSGPLLPVLSPYTSRDNSSDVPVPVAGDLLRASTPRRTWTERKAMALWRGAPTGASLLPTGNPRVWLARLGTQPYTASWLDAKLTSISRRDRVAFDTQGAISMPLDNMYPHASRANFVTPDDQQAYRVVVYADGHAAASRLAEQLGSGSAVVCMRTLDPHCANQLWFSPLLQEGVHVSTVDTQVPALQDAVVSLSGERGEAMARAACELYDTEIGPEGARRYLASILCELSRIESEWMRAEQVSKLESLMG